MTYIQDLKQRFDSLRVKVDKVGEENLGQIQYKLDLLTELKEIAGDLWAAWENCAKTAKTTKKEVINHVKVYGAVLSPDKPYTTDETIRETLALVEAKEATTDKMREATAELVAKPYEDEENKATASAGHYKNKWDAITEKIQVLKKKHDFLNK